MRNIFLFIQRYFTFISFLMLQIVCIVLLTRSSKSHDTFFSTAANEVTGRINRQYSGVTQYFALRETNRLLAEENTQLRNLLKDNFIDTVAKQITMADSTMRDSSGRSRKFSFLPAHVIGNTVTLQYNYLTIERGSLQGVKKGMAVTSPQGIVGVVVEVGPNISRIMSLLHRKSKVSAMLKKDGVAGSLEWDGDDPSYLILTDIPKSSAIKPGDTVLTSTYSANFPPKLPIGTVNKISSDAESNFYTLRIKTAVNFFSIQYVYLIDNVFYQEQMNLEQTTPVRQ
ncbi:MAG: rod shape-determining protein MreC [Bacteroidota bacterium]